DPRSGRAHGSRHPARLARPDHLHRTVMGLFQTARSIFRFWRMTANIDGAHAELERNLMQDKWGPPANGEGWPTFDERGKRILEDHCGPEEKSQIDKGIAEIKRLLGPEIEMFPEHAEIGGEA